MTCKKTKTVNCKRFKLADINDVTDIAVEQAKQTQVEQDIINQNIEFYRSFILGQGSIYTLADQNLHKSDAGEIVPNGPKYIERQWNQRELNQVAVADLFKATGAGTLLYKYFQENAMTVGISNGIVSEATPLAQYQSNDFPRISFQPTQNQQILIVNGHHRIAVNKLVNKDLLDKQSSYQSIMEKNSFTTAKEEDESEISEAREQIVKIEATLYKSGFWGTVFINLGKYLQTLFKQKILTQSIVNLDAIYKDPRAEEIKAYFSRNPVHFHLPDTPGDTLRMILKSVRGMDLNTGYRFLQKQLQRSDIDSQTQINKVLRNPHLLFIFADINSIPMFDKLRLVNFHNLDKWRHGVSTWLTVFLEYARDSYKYLALPVDPTNKDKEQEKTILDIRNIDLEYDFGFLDEKFHTIIDDAYKTHLSNSFFLFATSDLEEITVKGVTNHSWSDAFESYSEEVIAKLTTLSETKNPKLTKAQRRCMSQLPERAKYILEDAYQQYPFISHLGAPLPLASESFILDIAQCLHLHEASIFTVSLAQCKIPGNLLHISYALTSMHITNYSPL